MIQHDPLRLSQQTLPLIATSVQSFPYISICSFYCLCTDKKNLPRIDLYIDSLRFGLIFISLFPVALICAWCFVSLCEHNEQNMVALYGNIVALYCLCSQASCILLLRRERLQAQPWGSRKMHLCLWSLDDLLCFNIEKHFLKMVKCTKTCLGHLVPY